MTFKCNLLKLESFYFYYSWHTILYWFRVYNIMIWHLCTLQIDYHYTIVIICHHSKLLKYYCPYSLCCRLHSKDLFYNGKFVPLEPLHPSHFPSQIYLSADYHPVLFVSFLESIRKWNNTVYIFLFLKFI